MTSAAEAREERKSQASPEVREIHRRMLRRRKMTRGSVYLLAAAISIWLLLPILFIGSMALTTPEAVRTFPKGVLPFIPFSFDSMRFFLESDGVLPGFLNSVIVAMITLVLSTVIAAPAGYAVSRYFFKGRDAFRLGILAVRAFPIVILAIPIAVMFLSLGVYDNVGSLAVMHTALTLPTTVLVIGSVFASVPYELEEAALVFGCTKPKAFRHIVLPLVLPGVAAAAIFTFVMSWNEVFAASILTVQNRTLPAQVLFALDGSPEHYQFAAAFFMLIPSLVFIFAIRRYLFNMWGQVTK